MKKIMKVLLSSIVALGMFNIPLQAKESDYIIIPKPHAVDYLEGTTTLGNQINIVKKGSFHNHEVEALKTVFKGRVISESSEVEEGKLNVLLVKNDADSFIIDNNASLSQTGYDQNTVIVKDDKIAINASTDAGIFYGIQTLKALVEQSQSSLRNVLIKDYADVKYRGFIEGYYGFPWTHESRLSLMEFAGKFKANTYIFAPKDDEYHASKWRDLYPESEHAKILELVSKGKETGTKFVWTLHPFIAGQRFNFGNYEQEINHMKQKFEQLYSFGVRQFGILADDVGQINRNDLVRMITEIANWAKEKGDVEDVLFCPAGYNHAWQGNYGELKKLNEVPENVQFFWTGDTVVNKITQPMVNRFINGSTTSTRAGRSPYIWLNWPVNDYKKGRLLMGPGTVMEPGVQNLVGVVTNPMTEPQPSKVGIFATVNYGWNNRDFNADQVWEQGFKFIDETAHVALKEISKHLQDVSPSGHGLVLEESVELAPLINSVKQGLENDDYSQTDVLQAEMEKIIAAIDTFNETASNIALKEEMKPWLDALKYQSQATIKLLQALSKPTINEKWLTMNEGMKLVEFSQNQKRDIFPRGSVNVEVGAKHLVPLKDALLAHLNQKINPNEGNGFEYLNNLNATPFISNDIRVASENLNKILDNNSNTYVNLKNKQGDNMPEGAYIGLRYNNAMNISKISIEQLRPGNTTDKFAENSILEYSIDGNSFTELARVSDANFTINTNIVAKEIRLRNAAYQPYWASFKEFKVVTENRKNVFTNQEALKEKTFSIKENVFTLNEEVTLQPNEYIGMDLGKIREFETLENLPDNLTVEYSKNDVVYHNEKETARYVRFVNKTQEAITTTINTSITTKEIYPIRLNESSYNEIQGIENVFDNNATTKVWFRDYQVAGRHAIFNLGQEIEIRKIKLVNLDSENDWLRHGKLEAFVNEEWVELLDVDAEDDNEISSAYPSYAAPTRFKENVLETPVSTKLLRLRVTKYSPSWLRFSDIVINDGQYFAPENKPQVTKTADDDDYGNNKFFVDDKVLKTSYHSKTPGELVYYIDHPSQFKHITLLTSGEEVMNASILNEKEQWIDLGPLTSNYSRFNVESFRNVLAVKLTWQNESRNIHEILFDDFQPYLSRSDLGSITTNNEETRLNRDGNISNAFDGNLNSLWHTLWDGGVNSTNPAEVEITLKKPENLESLVYIPRRSAYNGIIQEMEIYAKQNGNYTLVKDVTLALSNDRKEITFDTPLENVEAIKLSVKRGYGTFASASEFVLKRKEKEFVPNEKAIALMEKVVEYTKLLKDDEYLDESELEESLQTVFNALISEDLSDEALNEYSENLDRLKLALEKLSVYTLQTPAVDVHAKGVFDESFAVTVGKVEPSEAMNDVLREKAALDNEVNVYEITSTQKYKNTTFKITFKVEKPIEKIVHLTNSGEVEVFENLVYENGEVTITTNSLSPFALISSATNKDNTVQPNEEQPKVKEDANPKEEQEVIKKVTPTETNTTESKQQKDGKKAVGTNDKTMYYIFIGFIAMLGFVILKTSKEK